MNPRIAANQQRTFLALVAGVLPLVRRDSALPRRIRDLLGRNRALGARDRRLYRELLYTTLRFLPWVEPGFASDPDLAARAVALLAPDLPDTRAYRAALLPGLAPAGPGPITLADQAARLHALTGRRCDPAELLPAWFRTECPEAFLPPQLEALNTRAPLWLRLQVGDPSLVLDECRARGWPGHQPADAPGAVRLPPDADVARLDAYRRGFCEIQDLGSQMVLLHAPLAPGQLWLDACAGAGGKTLQLARLLGPTGRVEATDSRPEALAELRERAARARLTTLRLLPPAPPGAGRHPDFSATGYDGVLVDAPCSGTGTWRRLPHMKWCLQPAMVAAFAATQTTLLHAHAPLVRPGGLLVYATCSLARQENHTVAAAFLATHPEFEALAAPPALGSRFDQCGHTLLPGTHDTDGFYVAVLRRKPTV